MTIVMFTNGIMTIVINRVKRPIRRAFTRGLKDSLALLADPGSDGVAAPSRCGRHRGTLLFGRRVDSRPRRQRGGVLSKNSWDRGEALERAR
jgi:hypothetical protein